jgi:hypothetical protein
MHRRSDDSPYGLCFAFGMGEGGVANLSRDKQSVIPGEHRVAMRGKGIHLVKN